jgi:hypothetical protein
MSAHGDSHSQGNHDVRFEETDVATRPIVVAVVGLSVFTLVFTGIAHLYFHFLAKGGEQAPAAQAAAKQWHLGDFGNVSQKMAADAAAKVAEPRLQLDPKLDLQVLRASEAKVLGTFGWVDKDAGIAQVSIERAKELLLAKGLPARDAAVPAKMAAHTYAAPAQAGEGAGAPDWFGGAGIGHDRSAAPAEGGHGAAHAPKHAAEAHGH